MANTPELSIKVNVDPVVDGDKLVDDIEQQVKQVKELPKVHVDVDVGDFHKSLNDKLKAELKEANDKMSYYLTNLTQNSDKLNKVVNNLFADTDFSKKIVEQFKQVNTAFEQTKTILAGSNNFLDSIFKKTNLSKADDFRSLVSDTSEEIKKLYKNDIGSNEFEKQLDIVSKKAAELNIVISELTSVKTKRPDLLKSLGYNKNSYDLAIRSLKDTYDYLNDIVKSKGLSGESLITYFKDNDLFDPDTALDISDALENGLKEFEVIQQKYVDNINKLNNLKSVHIKSLTEDDMSGTFDKNRITEIAEAYTHVLSILVSQQDLLNKAKEQTLVLEDQLLSKTKFVSESMSQEVSSLQNLFSELAKSDLGKQIPALSEYMKTKAEIDSTKNTENAKAINFSASADKAQAYETALNGIKTILGHLGRADAFSGINSNIETNADKFDNAKTSVDNYLEAIENARTKSQSMKILKSVSTGLNTDNVDAYSKKVSDIKTNLYDLKDKIFPDVYESINVTYKGIFDNAILNAQAYIDKLKEIPDAVHNKSAIKNQSTKKSENIDATNIKNYATLLNGIQTGISDMKTNIIPGFDQVLNTNGQKLAQLGLVLKNYVDTYKKGLKAVEQAEKDTQKTANVPTTSVIKTENVTVVGDAVTVPTKSVLGTKDVVPPIDPIDIKGKVTLEVEDIKVPDKIDLNGNLIIKNATKEIRALTQLANSKSKGKVSPYKEGLQKSLAVLLKAQARIQNNLDKHSDGQEGSAEDRKYLGIINRRIRTTKGKLTTAYKGKSWQNEMWYNAAVEDADYIRNSYVGVNNDKKLAKEETDLLVDFNTQVQTSVELLRELDKIDATKTPVKYAEVQKTLNASISETRRLFKEIDDHKLTGTDQYKNAIESARSAYALGQEEDSNQAQKNSENQQKKDIARYKTLLKEKYSLQDKIASANKNTDTTAWQQMLSDTENEMRTLRSGFKNWFVTDELDLIEKSYQATANNKANNAKDKEEADYVKDIVSDYSTLIKLQNKRTSLFKPEDVDRLKDVDDAITRISTHIQKSKTDAANAGFNLTNNQGIKDQEAELLRAKKISDREFTKNLTNYNDAQVAKTNLSTMQKLNTEYDRNIKLRKELSEIDQTRSPVAYGHKQGDIQDSNAEIKRLKSEAKTTGLDTTEATNEFLKKSADLRENIVNKAKDAADKAQTITTKQNNDLIADYNEQLQITLDILERLGKIDQNKSPIDYANTQKELADSKAKSAQLYADISKKGLQNSVGFQNANNDYVAGFNKIREAEANRANDEWLKNTEQTISQAKNDYIKAFKELQKKREELTKTSDPQTKALVNQEIAKQKAAMKQAGHTINSYGSTATGLVQDAWSEISSIRNNNQILSQINYENKADKEAAATKKDNLDLLEKYNKALNEELKLYKNLRNADPNSNPEDYTLKQNLLADQQAKTEELRKQIQKRGLDTTPEYQRHNARHSEGLAGIDRAVSNRNNEARQKANDEADAEVVENLIGLYRQLDKATQSRAKLFKDEDADDLKEADDLINKLRDDIDKLETAAQYSGIDLANNDSYMAAFENSDAVRTKAERDFNANRAKYSDQQTDALMKEYQNQVNKMQRAGLNRENALGGDRPWKANQFNSQYNEAEESLKKIDDELQNRGLSLEQSYLDLLDKKAQAENVVTEAQNKRLQSQRESVEVTNKEVVTINDYVSNLNKLQNRVRNAGGTDTDTYNLAAISKGRLSELRDNLANAVGTDTTKDQVMVDWAKKYNINGIDDYVSGLERISATYKELNVQADAISSNDSFRRSTYKARTELANLQSQLHDYLKKSPGVESGMAEDVQRLQRALADPNAYKNVAALKQSFAELRAQAKAAGLETESLINKFKNLFGQHFSTMITMAALHQMQNALQVVYQNVVQIDTALTELRKVSNMTASDMEKYMDRAAESAQKLGVSISDYINSTADWKRLGYSDEDAENLATYSTLLKNVGDGIDDVNTSSSYLISTLQGFGLLAEDAEDVVNKIDAVANTQPVTAEAIGEILTRSSAAMASANNTLSETIALGTTAYSVLQNAESTGTLLKTLSMYLRAAKSDLEDAGESAEGCANSVSELRSELKSLTGVDIMIDNKNFKSTYQIMKELSEVWGNLSDVTKANVTEMIGGKVYPYVQQCA